MLSIVFYFNDTATTEIYTLSLHDALPIYHPRAAPRHSRTTDRRHGGLRGVGRAAPVRRGARGLSLPRDRKSTRLNSSHVRISYAVFCLKKKSNGPQHQSHFRWCSLACTVH